MNRKNEIRKEFAVGYLIGICVCGAMAALLLAFFVR